MFEKVFKKVIMVMAVMSIMTVGAFAQQGKVPSVCKNINIRANVPMPVYKIMSERDVHGLCEMILNIRGEIVPVYATKDFVIAGEMFSNRTQVTVNQIRKIKSKLLKGRFSKAQKALNSLVVANFNPKAKKYVYFIVDPLCPYCEAAKSKLESLAKQHHFGIRLVFFPVHGAPAIKDIKGFICSHKTFKDYIKGDFGNKFCKKGEDYINKSISVNRSLMVNGTPTIITYKGDFILGYQPKKVLKDLGF